MPLFIWLWALVAVAPPSPTLPERSPPPAPRCITESEYLAVLKQEDYLPLRALSGDLETAEALRLKAATLTNPGIELEREAPDDEVRETTLRLAWEPPRPKRRRLSLQAADASVEAAAGRNAVFRLDLRIAMRRAFADWAIADARVRRLRYHATRTGELTVRTLNRAESGEVSGLVARRLKMVGLQAGADLAQAEAEEAQARAQALIWRPDLDPSLTPALPRLGPAPSSLDLSGRGDIAALKAELAQVRLKEELHRTFLKLPELALGWQKVEERSSTTGGPVFGLSWRLPVFDRNQGDGAAARARARSLEAQLLLLIQGAERELQGALAAYERLRQGAVAAALPTAESDGILTAATASYRLGESDATALVDTLNAVRTTELVALRLYSQALQAHHALERLVGHAVITQGGETP